jgi:hypothetical protein
MYRTPGRKPDPEPEPQVPSFFVVWPEKESEPLRTYHTDRVYHCVLKYTKCDTLEAAQKIVEARHKKDPNAQVFMFEHVSTNFKVV